MGVKMIKANPKVLNMTSILTSFLGGAMAGLFFT